jgi:hypothetical protein
MPPTTPMSFMCSSGFTWVDPRNIMCSNMWAKPCRSGPLVARADVIDHAHVHDRRLPQRRVDDAQPVFERLLLKLDRRHLSRLRLSRLTPRARRPHPSATPGNQRRRRRAATSTPTRTARKDVRHRFTPSCSPPTQDRMRERRSSHRRL